MRYLILLFVVLPYFSVSQINAVQKLDFKFINQKPESVLQNDRLELGVNLPDSILQEIERYMQGKPNRRKGLNPFMSWDVDVKAHFTHKESQEQFSAIGFWFTDIERDEENNRWNQKSTNHQFRIRYAPTNLGEYEVSVSVSIKKQPAYRSDAKDFTVVDSDHKGFVQLNDSTEYFERDGQTFIATGANLPYPYNKNNKLYSAGPQDSLDVSAWTTFHKLIEDYVTEGGEYFRFFMHPSVADVEFEEVGYYQDRQNMAWEMDQMITFCEENNTLIHFNLMYHSYFMKMGDYYQFAYDYADYWHDPEVWPYEDPNLPSGYSVMLDSKTPSDMFLSQKSMQFLKERTRYIMARWGYSTSIAAIELLCEPWHIDEHPFAGEAPYDEVSKEGDVARKAIYEYHKQMSNYIIDSIEYNQHLLTTVGRFPSGNNAIFSHYTPSEPEYADSSWFLDHIDFLTISYYSNSPEKMIISKSGKNNEVGEFENSMTGTIHRLKETYDKPVFFGESDHGDDSYECSDYQMNKVDLMRYPYTGAIGHFIWGSFIYDESENPNEKVRDQRVTWKDVVESKDYFNSSWFLNLVNNQTALGRAKTDFNGSDKDLVEHQYILDQNTGEGAGYIYNRTFNMKTASGEFIEEKSRCYGVDSAFSNAVDISWKPDRMKVEGVGAFNKYRVYFYDYKNHSFLYQAELRSNLFGKLKLTHPLLIPKKNETPLIGYKLEKM